MRDILVLCPQERDLKAIRAAGLEGRYRVHFAGSDLDQLEDFDPEAFLDECESIPADGVWAPRTSRHCSRRCSPSGAACRARARRRSSPASTSRPHARFNSGWRRRRRRASPSSTGSRRSTSRSSSSRSSAGCHRTCSGSRTPTTCKTCTRSTATRRATRRSRPSPGADPAAAHGFMAEELLSGEEVTLEGYVHGGRVTTIGVTDSVKYPGTFSFERFEYPSALPRGAARRSSPTSPPACCRRSASRAASSTSSSSSRTTGRPRSSRSTAGSRPSSRRSFRPCTAARPTTRSSSWPSARIPVGRRRSRTASAVSYVLRVFEDALVEAVPDPDARRRAARAAGALPLRAGRQRLPELPAGDPLRRRRDAR